MIGSGSLVYNGLPMITSIPEGGKYMYVTIKLNTTQGSTASGSVKPEYCDIILHKGSAFTSGDSMTLANAKEWIMDFEPNWVKHDKEWIAAAECVAINDGSGVTLYSPFDNTKKGTRGIDKTSQYLDPQLSQEYNTYYMRYLAERRGMQLIDYEASKILAMLFFAKYGVKNSQEQLGDGENNMAKILGNTASIGIKDTICKNLTTGAYLNDTAIAESIVHSSYTWTKSVSGKYTYTKMSSNNFLGIENISGNLAELMDRVFYMNETAANGGKVRITMPNGDIRRVFSVTSLGNYPISMVHGRYCDIINAGTAGGSTASGYGDTQIVDNATRSRFIDVHAYIRSGYGSSLPGGMTYFNGGYFVANSNTGFGSRLMFRGIFTEVQDPQTFMNALDDRTIADDDREL